jgi:phosphoribosyl 1,2-cyclic phosphate phosphodiesterase
MKITILGSGTSGGIPVVGCGCPVCNSGEVKDTRLRASLLIQGPGGESLIIDTGPDFRFQALRAGLKRLDGIFLTHAHADHIHGMDDVRPLSRERPIPVYGNRQTIAEMRERFSYVFRETQLGGGKPRLLPREIEGPVRTGGLVFHPLPVKHGKLDILGWYVKESPGGGFDSEDSGVPGDGGLLYLTDTSAIPSATRSMIPRPHTIIIGGLRVRPHPTHFSFEEAMRAAMELGGERIYLTHICHEHSHREIEGICGAFAAAQGFSGFVSPAWDGLELEVP